MSDIIIIDGEVVEIITSPPETIEVIQQNPTIEMNYMAPGPPGPQGPPGTSFTYTHSQDVASDIWVVEHNLGKFPSATIVDSGGTAVYGDIKYIDNMSLTISFSAIFSGKVYCN